ncbi:MAG: PAS domain S-box protein [Promethearchaeota archaeon]|nr:MAG: PAS domain S-box protein [Candidatus Lokiarchaeota archaeon]
MTYNREEIRENYKDLFENSLDLIYVSDLNGNFLDVNDLTLLALGYEREEIKHIKFLDLLEKDEIKIAYDALKEIIKTGKQSKRKEYKLRVKNGNFIFVETYAMALKRNGKIYAILGIGRNITDRKKAENRLIDSKEMFSTLYKEGPIATYTWKKFNDDFVLIEFNNAAEKITHGNVVGVLGHKALEMYKDRPDILDDLNKCFDEKTNITREMKYKFYFTEEEKYLLVNYGYVKPELVIVQTVDITEKVIAEEKLRQSEIKYRNMINNLDVGFYQVCLDGTLLTHNPAYNKILGFEPSESLVNSNVTNLWQYPELRNEYLQQILRDGYVRGYLCHALKKSGDKIVLELNSHLTRDMKGTPIRIDGTFIDITEKFTLERELKESEEKYRFFYENTPSSIVILNSRGKIIECNPATEMMFGYSRDYLIGKYFQKISVIHPNYLTNIIDLFQRFIKGEKIHRIDLQMYKKDRSLIWVSLQASLIQMQNEYYVQALFNEITKRKQAELLINEEVKKLKDLDQIRKNLISRVSHELKTPLATVCGGAELFSHLYNAELNDEQIELINLIEKGGKRLKFLVDNLIDISRIEYNKFKLSKKQNDLSELIRESTSEMLHFAKERNLSLNIELVDEISLYIDRIRIEQVIMNLLSNAIKNTPPLGKIKIKVEETGNWAQITISDTGVGLTRDEMDILFTRFGKIERYGDGLEYINIQGSGLGLFISKEIIDLHNGNIRVESEGRGKGSSFIVKLPMN